MAFYVLFTIAAFYNLDINQIDVKIVFLYRKIDWLLFTKMSKSYYDKYKDMVCRFNKALYSLKQLPRF